ERGGSARRGGGGGGQTLTLRCPLKLAVIEEGQPRRRKLCCPRWRRCGTRFEADALGPPRAAAAADVAISVAFKEGVGGGSSFDKPEYIWVARGGAPLLLLTSNMILSFKC
ncbi:unnamed protein product, partial [Laminaria digitata]